VKLGSAAAAPDPALRRAALDMEAILLRQLLRSSGAYGGGEGPGASVRADLFASALADAVTQAGGLGLAETLERSLSGAAPPAAPGPVALAPTSSRSALSSILPVAGHLTSGFGLRTDPFTGTLREHDGLDLGAPEGTAIRATADGVVRSAGPRGGYGNAVEIDHGNGLSTLYGHASELLVSPGDTVRAGQEIARVGSSGRSTGAHLHFEVRVGGRPVDPGRVLKVYAARVEADLRSGP
jgi:murein DD-endopeptidase MepM/ murein hydrolase activator NlpD